MFCNVRSLVKNAESLVASVCERNYDLVLLTESWLSPQVDECALLGILSAQYDAMRSDRLYKKRGGIIILLKKTHSCRVVFKESVRDGYELLVCDIFAHTTSVRLIGVYRTPSCSINNSIQLLKAMSDFSAFDVPCILLGDFNLPDLCFSTGSIYQHSAPSSTNITQKFRDFTIAHGFLPYVTSPTRGNAILDLLFCNESSLVKNVTISAPIGSSDHSTITFDLRLQHLQERITLKPDFKNADYPAIERYLSTIDWLGSFSSVSTVNEMYEIFLAVLHHTIELFVPIRKVVPIQLGLPHYLRNKLKKRAQAWELAVSMNDHVTWDKFKEVNVRTEKAINKYNIYLEKRFLMSKDKSKFFRYISSRTGKGNSASSLRLDNGEIVLGDEPKANLLAKVFQKSLLTLVLVLVLTKNKFVLLWAQLYGSIEMKLLNCFQIGKTRSPVLRTSFLYFLLRRFFLTSGIH